MFLNQIFEGDVVQFPKKHKGDLASVNDCPKCGGDLQGGKYMGHEVKVCMPCKQVYLPPNSGIDQQGNPIKEQGVAEDSTTFDPMKGIHALFALERQYKSGNMGSYQELMQKLRDHTVWTNVVGHNLTKLVPGFTVNDFWTLDNIVRDLSDGYGLPEWFRIINDGGWEDLIEKYKQYMSQRHGQSMNEQGVAEGSPIVVMPRADRLKKAEPTKVRYQGDIVPPTKPPSTEKRGVKGRPGQRPMPEQGVAEGWKDKVAGGALALGALGGLGALQNAAPNVTVRGHQMQLANPGTQPDDAKLVTTDDGKKVYAWKTTGHKNRSQWVYRPVEQVKEQGVAEGSAQNDAVLNYFAELLADELGYDADEVLDNVVQEMSTPSGIPVYTFTDDTQTYYMGVLGGNKGTPIVSTSHAGGGQDNELEIYGPGEQLKYVVKYGHNAATLHTPDNKVVAQAKPGQDEYSLVGIALDMLWGKMQHRFMEQGVAENFDAQAAASKEAEIGRLKAQLKNPNNSFDDHYKITRQIQKLIGMHTDDSVLGKDVAEESTAPTKYRATVEYGPTAADAHFVTVTANSTEEAEAKVQKWCEKKGIRNPMITINGADRPVGVKEGIFDRFKKKPAAPEVADPGNYPRIGSDIAQWMADTVEYHKSKFPDTVWKLFCPTYPDYLPVRVRVGTSEKTMQQHMDDYIALRNANPEAVRIARQKFEKHNIYPSGPRDDYRGVNEGSEQRNTNALWAQITDYEKRQAKAERYGRDTQAQHFKQMADQLRSKLPTTDEARGDYKDPKEADYDDSFQDMVKRVAAQEKRKQPPAPQPKK